MKDNSFSRKIDSFKNRIPPEEGLLAGYGALIAYYDLKIPMPDQFSIIGQKHKRYETREWKVFSPRHTPGDSLFGHLIFALKYEGVDLFLLKCLFEVVDEKKVIALIKAEPKSQYTRRIWFLYEWLFGKELDIPDLLKPKYIPLLDEKLQYPGPSINSPRHKVRNNLPGTRDFCPLIRKTEKLETFLALGLDKKNEASMEKVHKDLLLRAAAFLLLKDSKASYAIEGESPPQNRAQRWGKAIGQAGRNPLTKEELVRLQGIVIEDRRFVRLGLREQEGFIGVHDRINGAPIPDHISAKWKDVVKLLDGLLATNEKLQVSDFDPVLAAAMVAFGFVFIHPFEDGNGIIHRYIIHHILVTMGFSKSNLVFPVSAAILNRIDEYRNVLEAYSSPRMDLIDWKPTPKNNVEIQNETIDLYRYFDATRQAEFLYKCVQETVEEIIPQEVDYLLKYDQFKSRIEQYYDMPEKFISLLVRFLGQGDGKLSKRARKKEFKMLTSDEMTEIEEVFVEIFGEND